MNTPNGNNPYQPPKADVTPPPQDFDAGDLISGGQSVPAGNALAWIGSGFSLFTKSPGVWILNVIILFLLSIVLGLIPVIGRIASNLLMPVVVGGILLGCRSLDAGDTLRVEHLFAGFREKTGQLVLVGLLTLVATIVIIVATFVLALAILGTSILHSLGDQQAMMTWFLERGWMMLVLLVLIAVALFIPVAMANWFAPALVVFHNMDAVSAMKQSFQGCLRNFVPFLLYGIVYLVLAIVAVIPIFLGLLVLVPMSFGSLYASYKDIFLEK